MVSQITSQVKGVINGQTVSLADLTNVNISGLTGFANNSISLSFTHPIKLDPGTAITFDTSAQGTNSVVRCNIHLIEERR